MVTFAYTFVPETADENNLNFGGKPDAQNMHKIVNLGRCGIHLALSETDNFSCFLLNSKYANANFRSIR